MGYAVQNMSLRNLNKVSFFVDKLLHFVCYLLVWSRGHDIVQINLLESTFPSLSFCSHQRGYSGRRIQQTELITSGCMFALFYVLLECN